MTFTQTATSSTDIYYPTDGVGGNTTTAGSSGYINTPNVVAHGILIQQHGGTAAATASIDAHSGTPSFAYNASIGSIDGMFVPLDIFLGQGLRAKYGVNVSGAAWILTVFFSEIT
jgi:hypothetical protein